jgi:Ring finger domain
LLGTTHTTSEQVFNRATAFNNNHESSSLKSTKNVTLRRNGLKKRSVMQQTALMVAGAVSTSTKRKHTTDIDNDNSPVEKKQRKGSEAATTITKPPPNQKQAPAPKNGQPQNGQHHSTCRKRKQVEETNVQDDEKKKHRRVENKIAVPTSVLQQTATNPVESRKPPRKLSTDKQSILQKPSSLKRKHVGDDFDHKIQTTTKQRRVSAAADAVIQQPPVTDPVPTVVVVQQPPVLEPVSCAVALQLSAPEVIPATDVVQQPPVPETIEAVLPIDDELPVCTLCLYSVDPDDVNCISLSGCKHKFHFECDFMKWATRESNTCPCCKTRFEWIFTTRNGRVIVREKNLSNSSIQLRPNRKQGGYTA